jgi:hypothetical protein
MNSEGGKNGKDKKSVGIFGPGGFHLRPGVRVHFQ